MSSCAGLAGRTLSGLAAAVLAVTACGLEAQAPERPQEVEVPGLDIMLRAVWQLLFHDGCRFAVPLSWHPDPDEAFARAPGGSSLSIQMLKTTNWAAHKADVSSAYARPKVVHEDSNRRLWLEIDDGSRLQHYIAVADCASVCTCWLEIRAGGTSAAREIVQRIADSIGLAPENWPSEDK